MGERDVSTRLGNLPDRGGIEAAVAAAVAAEAVWQMDRYLNRPGFRGGSNL